MKTFKSILLEIKRSNKDKSFKVLNNKKVYSSNPISSHHFLKESKIKPCIGNIKDI